MLQNNFGNHGLFPCLRSLLEKLNLLQEAKSVLLVLATYFTYVEVPYSEKGQYTCALNTHMGRMA